MGGIWTSADDFYEALTEVIGIKSGLIVEKKDLRELLQQDPQLEAYSDLQAGLFRIRSEVFEAVVEFLLYKVGVLERPFNPVPVGILYHRYKRNKKKLDLAMEISSQFTNFLEGAIEKAKAAPERVLDPIPFIEAMSAKFGAEGLEMALMLVESLHVQLVRNPWGPNSLEYDDPIHLKDLFENEGLNPMFGKFIDQRYIDFLHRNFEAIDRINWRKFEGLTAEFFDRAGFRVALGAGRNDDGIDVRVWPASNLGEVPPAIIVQCKRQKATVEKVVVKALYADVLAEGAKSGLIVTTARLSRGARKVCVAREYPISEADRSSLRDWIKRLRSPGAGWLLS